MKEFIILVTFALTAYAAKVDHVPTIVSTPGPHHDKVGVSVGQQHQHVPHVGGGGDHVQQIPLVASGEQQKPPKIPSHVQHVVEQAHQHIPQVINHHIGQSKPHQGTQQHGVSHVKVRDVSSVGQNVPHVGGQQQQEEQQQQQQHHHHVHVGVTHQNADGQKHVAHNVPHVSNGIVVPALNQQHAVPQVVKDKIQKVEQHVQQVMHQAHQHIPQVINHHIAEKQKGQQGHHQGQQGHQQGHQQGQQHHPTTHGPHVVHPANKVTSVPVVPSVGPHVTKPVVGQHSV